MARGIVCYPIASELDAMGEAIVEARQDRPDGALLSQRYGNGLTKTRTYDLQGRLAMWSIPGVLSRTFGRDANGNTTALGDRSYRYDAAGRLAERSPTRSREFICAAAGATGIGINDCTCQQ